MSDYKLMNDHLTQEANPQQLKGCFGQSDSILDGIIRVTPQDLERGFHRTRLRLAMGTSGEFNPTKTTIPFHVAQAD